MFFRRENDGGASALHDFPKQGVFQQNRLVGLTPERPGGRMVNVVGCHTRLLVALCDFGS